MADLISMLAAAAGGGGPTDPYFNQTTLLLHGDGTNGAQNNTFLDSSTNNFTITRNGNTTQGTFSPFSVAEGEWSNYFDGSGDYLSLTGSSLGSGNITLEFWVYLPTSGIGLFFDSRTSDVSSTGFAFYRNSSNYLAMFTDGTGTAGTTVIPTNQWVHLALVRNSGTFYGYMNGVQQFTRANSATMSLTSWKIFAQYDNTNLATGYLSNFRITTTAVYTAAFTPPTAPLTAVSGTSLLTCQSNRFVDNSTNAFAITRNGDVKVTPFSPFAPSAAYSASTNGGSGYFDGTGDYLTVGTASDWTFLHNGSDWTVEFWMYHSTTALDGIISTTWWSGETGMSVFANLTTANVIAVEFYRGVTASFATFTSNADLKLFQWNHVAITFQNSGKTCSFYINGVAAGSSSNTGFSYSASSPTNTLAIARAQGAGGANPPGAEYTGYISSLRISTNVRTGLTSLPSAPYTSDANTKLLNNFTNAGIFDNTGKNNLETVGNAQIDTTTKKYGTGSMEFDGTGDYLDFPQTVDFAFGTGDFTVEFWAYLNSATGTFLHATTDTAGTFGVSSINNDSDVFAYTVGGSSVSWLNVTLSTGTWQHYAFVRSGSTLTWYLNGVSQGGKTFTNNVTATGRLRVGSYYDGTIPLNGFIDDLRITKGVARYTANFTPPAAAFPNE
jgi:hypothetical protein